MRYTAMGRSPRNAVSVPALSGGVNLGDALNLVDDNQLTDCKNVWYKDGMLQTRPAVVKYLDVCEDEILADYDLEVYHTNIISYLNGNKYTFAIQKKIKRGLSIESGEWAIEKIDANVLMFGENGLEKTLKVNCADVWDYEVLYSSKPTKSNGIGLYMAISRQMDIVDFGTPTSRKIVELFEATTDGSFEMLTEDELYSPIVMINGKGNSYTELPAATQSEYAPSSFLEGYSGIYNVWHRYCYTTDGVSTRFAIPQSIRNCKIKIQYTNHVTGKTFLSETLEVFNSNTNPIEFGDFFLKAYIGENEEESEIEISPKEGKKPFPSSLGRLANNLIIYVMIEVPQWDSNLYGCTISEHFGGSSGGIHSGTRTFLSGIKIDGNQNMLNWSDLNNPTYFPENNYAHVGSSSQRITALAKQDDMLVVYKENELFYTTYAEGGTYTADDIASGKVIDVTTLSAVFPITQIHSVIGCDLPNTIQLCGNRLVWACKDGNVYTLKTADQYSTANVAKISSLVDKRLKEIIKTESNLEANFSAIYKGHYLLVFGNCVFAMDYDQYYFNSLPAYSDTKKAQKKLIWYYWEFPTMEGSIFKNFFSVNEQCYLFNVSTYLPASSGVEYANYTMFRLTENELQDECLKQAGLINSGDHIPLELVMVSIESVIQTKMFDFGAMERFKSIEQLYIGFGKAEGETALQYITENGTLDKGTVNIEASSDIHSPQYVETKRFLPCIKRALRFGLRITTKGRIALGGILIKFKYMGVTR